MHFITNNWEFLHFSETLVAPGADLMGEWADVFSHPSGIRPPADPKGPPLYESEIFIFRESTKIF